MNLQDKKNQLQKIYYSYEVDVAEYKKDAVCFPGCAYCCTHFGTLDITTLEGIIIRERIKRLRTSTRKNVLKKIDQNFQAKEQNEIAVCPFLNEDKMCLIYDIRPFSCRQLYSLKICGEHGPIVHPQAVFLARQKVKEIQRLDNLGYSGHLSFILHLLNQKNFRTFYLSGGFDPRQILDFGKSHGLVINHRLSSCR